MIHVNALNVQIPHTHISHNENIIINSVNLHINVGEQVAIIGASGAGKSTIAYAIAGLLPVIAPLAQINGNLLYNMKSLSWNHGVMQQKQLPEFRKGSISIIHQNAIQYLNPRISLYQQYYEILKIHHVQLRQHEYKEYLQEQSILFGLPSQSSFLQQKASQLSGGQQQRALILLAMLSQPKVLIADEFTTAQDSITTLHILETLLLVCEKYQTSLLLISHDMASVRFLASRIYVLEHGSIIEEGTTNKIFNHADLPYTKQLVSCV